MKVIPVKVQMDKNQFVFLIVETKRDQPLNNAIMVTLLDAEIAQFNVDSNAIQTKLLQNQFALQSVGMASLLQAKFAIMERNQDAALIVKQ